MARLPSLPSRLRHGLRHHGGRLGFEAEQPGSIFPDSSVVSVYRPWESIPAGFLDPVNWHEDRAARLAVFPIQPGQEPPPDKFKLVAKLDPHDSREALKYTDVETLRRYAAEEGAECRKNGSEVARNSERALNPMLFT